MIDSRDHGEVILGAVLTMLRPLGTILGLSGTIWETPLPLCGESVDLWQFQRNSLTPIGHPFFNGPGPIEKGMTNGGEGIALKLPQIDTFATQGKRSLPDGAR